MASPDGGSVNALEKYAQRVEYERRFLVEPRPVRGPEPRSDWRAQVTGPIRRIEDRYLSGGRLRLRRVTELDSGRVQLKLTKKDASDVPHRHLFATILLEQGEFDALWTLPGHPLSKLRHRVDESGARFGVDVFQGPLSGLVLAEVEADSEETLAAICVPSFALGEVTRDPFFAGGMLCRTSPAELGVRLRELGLPLSAWSGSAG